MQYYTLLCSLSKGISDSLTDGVLVRGSELGLTLTLLYHRVRVWVIIYYLL